MGKFTPAPRLSAVAGSAPAPRLSAVAGSAPPLRGFLPWRDLHPRSVAFCRGEFHARSAAFCRGGISRPLRGFLPWGNSPPPAPLLCGNPAWLLLLYWNVFVLSKNFAAFPSAAHTALFTSFRIRFSPFCLRAGLRCRKRGSAAPNGPAAPHAERAQNEPYGHRTGAERQHSAASPAPTDKPSCRKRSAPLRFSLLS